MTNAVLCCASLDVLTSASLPIMSMSTPSLSRDPSLTASASLFRPGNGIEAKEGKNKVRVKGIHFSPSYTELMLMYLVH